MNRHRDTRFRKINESDIHPKITCDWCGFTSDKENRFTTTSDGQTVCKMCMSRNSYFESGKPVGKIDGKTLMEWAKWLKEEQEGCCHKVIGTTAQNQICICMGWTNTGDGWEIAWKIGQQSPNNGMQTDLDIDFDMPSDPETGDVYDTESIISDEFIEDASLTNWNSLANVVNRAAQGAYEFALEVDGDDDLGEYSESWLGDKVKSGWNKVKTGAKNFKKAVGDMFKGPFRKGDHIVMKGEDGEEFKGTIKGFDRGDKTYEVLLGNAVSESFDDGVRGTQEQVLDMPDRAEELENEIEKLWDELGDIGGKNEIVLDLISRYVELEQIEPGRVDF